MDFTLIDWEGASIRLSRQAFLFAQIRLMHHRVRWTSEGCPPSALYPIQQWFAK